MILGHPSSFSTTYERSFAVGDENRWCMVPVKPSNYYLGRWEDQKDGAPWDEQEALDRRAPGHRDVCTHCNCSATRESLGADTGYPTPSTPRAVPIVGAGINTANHSVIHSV